MSRIKKMPVGFTLRGLLLKCGGGDVVAKECGLSRAPAWKCVPEKHVMTIARLSGLPVERIRPDFFPAE